MSDVIKDILRREAGFVLHPNDKGKATKFGITQDTLSFFRGRPVTVEDVRELTVDEAYRIYTEMYIKWPGFDKLPDSILKEHLIDFGVHSGPAVAIKKLQTVLGMDTDGVLGPLTINALSTKDPIELNRKLLTERLRMIFRIIKRDPKQATFGPGWCERLLEFNV